jgi:hypothetical protein
MNQIFSYLQMMSKSVDVLIAVFNYAIIIIQSILEHFITL